MKLTPENVDTIVVHCSATKASQDIGAYEIDEMHKAKGWNLIGYHAVIRRDGTIEGGRPLTIVGAHAYGHNLHSVAVCMVGGLDEQGKPEDNFTPKQYRSLLSVISNWQATFPNIKDVCGHRDLSPDVDGDGVIEPFEWVKDCPCFNVREWYSRVISNSAKEVPRGPDITRRSIIDCIRDFFRRDTDRRRHADPGHRLFDHHNSDTHAVLQGHAHPS